MLRPIIPEIELLIRQAIALGGSNSYVFSNAGTDEPMGKGAPLQLPYNLMQWPRRHEKYEMEHWYVHDLRKTARTNLSSLIEQHIAEVMLGHKLPKNWRIYDHYTYLKEQAEACRAWWQRLMTLSGENFEGARSFSSHAATCSESQRLKLPYCLMQGDGKGVFCTPHAPEDGSA